MKRKYEAPMMSFEDFELSANIAGSCEIKIRTLNNGDCGFDFGGETIFMQGIGGCKKPVNDDGTNGFCYDVPFGNNNLFNS